MLATAILFAGLVCLISNAQPARADTITVTTSLSGFANDGLCSLHEAVQSANTDSAVDGCVAGNGADDIVFDVTGGEITVKVPIITVTSPILLNGIGAKIIFSTTRVISNFVEIIERPQIVITGTGTLTATQLNALYKSAYNANGQFHIYSGTLILASSFLSGSVGGGGGPIVNSGGTVWVTNTVFVDNGSFFGGALNNVFGTAHVINSTFRQNFARAGDAIYNGSSSTLWVTNSLFIENSTGSGGTNLGRGVISNYGAATLYGNLFRNNLYLGGSTNGYAGVVWNSGILTATANSFVHNVVPDSIALFGAFAYPAIFVSVVDNSSAPTTLLRNNTTAEGLGLVLNYKGTYTTPLTVTLENNTFVNASQILTDRAQIEVYTNTVLLARANLIADSTTANDCAVRGGTLTDMGRNFASDASCTFSGAGSQNNAAPQLGPLTNNQNIRVGASTDGDFLLTYAPAPNSPACAQSPCAGAVDAAALPPKHDVYLPLVKR